MSFNYRNYYDKYEQCIQKKKISSNYKGTSTKQANEITNKYNKSSQKIVENNNIISQFNYDINNNNDENNINLLDEIKMLENLSFSYKKKKVITPMNPTVTHIYFYKNDRRMENFNLFKENELGLNIFDNKVDILQSEEDYESDDMIVMDGEKKSGEDLLKAVNIIKKNNFKYIYNYQKYYK